MALKKYNPVTPGTRFATVSTFEELTRRGSERSLLRPNKSKAGRNCHGRITVRHKGGGHKRMFRVIDFKRDKPGIKAKVAAIEYDPNRSARIALLNYADGEKRYIVAPAGLTVGAEIVSGPNAEAVLGNALPLEKIPVGLAIHNIEMAPGRGARLARSAGQSVQIMAKEGGFAHIRLPSGELRMINLLCMATIGQVGNTDHNAMSYGKAGRKRWLGIRPTVRGVAMNPVDHPMGGGEGRSSGGGHPVSPWGKLSKGKKTRRRRRTSDKFIMQRRK